MQKSTNPSVLKSGLRRGLRSNSLLLGPPLRGRPVPEDEEESNAEDGEEKGDDMDIIKPLVQNGESTPKLVGDVDGNSKTEQKYYLPTVPDGLPEKSLEVKQFKSYTNNAIDNKSVPSQDATSKSSGQVLNPQFKLQELSKFQQNSTEMPSVETIIQSVGESGPSGRSYNNHSKPVPGGTVTPQYPSVSNHPNQNGYISGTHNEISPVQQAHMFPGTALPVNQELQPQHTPVYVHVPTAKTKSLLVNGKLYQTYGTIGRGGSSKVIVQHLWLISQQDS